MDAGESSRNVPRWNRYQPRDTPSFLLKLSLRHGFFLGIMATLASDRDALCGPLLLGIVDWHGSIGSIMDSGLTGEAGVF